MSAATAVALGAAPLTILTPAQAADGECTPGHVRTVIGKPAAKGHVVSSDGLYRVRQDDAPIKITYSSGKRTKTENSVRKTWDVHGDLTLSPKAMTRLFANVEAKIGGSYKSDTYHYDSTFTFLSIKQQVPLKTAGRWIVYRGYTQWTTKWSKLQCNSGGVGERLIANGVVKANQKVALDAIKCGVRYRGVLPRAAQAQYNC